MNRDLAHQSIAVIGYGITGRSCVRFLLSQQAKVCVIDTDITIQDRVDKSLNETPALLDSNEHLNAAKPVVRTLVFSADMKLSDFSIVVLSPGVNPHQGCFERFTQAGGKLIGDIELFAWFNKTPLIGITGSNGKTTVTDMLGKILSSAGLQVELAGNYGKCALDVLMEEGSREYPLDVIVLELSSYQLEMTESLQLEYATVLNITEDHIDRHGTFEAYIKAKQRIFDMASNIIVNRNEAFSYPYAEPHQAAQLSTYRICAEVSETLQETANSIDGCAHYALGGGKVNRNGSPVLSLSELRLKGIHNYVNSMIVLAICDQLSLDRDACVTAICDYKGLAHRFETILTSTISANGKHSKVTWINDSKATNVGACEAALACFTHANEFLILIAGGDAKGADLTPLKKSIDAHVGQLIVLGKDANKFIELVPEAIQVLDLHNAVAAAISLIENASHAVVHVLLSPACASLDMFTNYQQRGDMFAAEVREQVA